MQDVPVCGLITER